MIKYIQGIRTIPGMMGMGIYPETRKDKILRGREYCSMPSYGYLPCRVWTQIINVYTPEQAISMGIRPLYGYLPWGA